MKRLLLFFVLAHLNAFATNWYMSPHAGVCFLMDSHEKMRPQNTDPLLKFSAHFKPGFTVGAAVGYRYDFVCIEVDYAYSYNELYYANSPGRQGLFPNALQGYVQSQFALLQSLFLIKNSSPVTPYLGGGIGYMRISSDQKSGFNFFNPTLVNDSVNAFAYRARGGLQYRVTEKFLADFHYSFLGAVNPHLKNNIGSSLDLNYFSNNFSANLTCFF
jgi:opacity protein-like surface antigen